MGQVPSGTVHVPDVAPGLATSSSRFGTTSGTRSILFRVPDDVRDLISGLVPDRRPDLVQDLRQDLSDRSGTRFYEIWYD